MSEKLKSMIKIINIIIQQHEKISGYSSLTELNPDQKELMAFRLLEILKFEKINEIDIHALQGHLIPRSMKD